MENKDFNSFRSAETVYPDKLIANEKVKEMLIKRELKPVHIQLFPTNKCNLKCSFCSCADRDKNIELPFDDIVDFYSENPSIQSTTISGGGEPLLYSDFSKLVYFHEYSKIKLGLTTNGLLMKYYKQTLISSFTWIRISLSEDSLDNDLFFIVKPYIENIKRDWAFSFVAGNDLEKNLKVINKFYKEYANDITHFRIVNDILNPDDRVEKIKTVLQEQGYDKIIYQSRQFYKRGANKCYLAILKPVIAADGNIYACCGAQYAIKEDKKDLNKALCLGNIKTYKFTDNYFDTKGVCEKCYYCNYNLFTDLFFNDKLIHKEFI